MDSKDNLPPPPYAAHNAPPGYPLNSQQQQPYPITFTQPGYQAPPGYPAGGQPGNQSAPGYPASYYTTSPGYQGQPMHGQTTQGVIITQPGVVIHGVAQPIHGAPPDYQMLAWFACICCCCPIGLLAIFKSNEVRNAVARGDTATANMASRSARMFSYLAIGLGLLFLFIYILLLIVWLIPLLSMRHY